MLVTIDASVAAAWLLPDEATPACDELLAQSVAGSITLRAPGLWLWETGNLLRMALMRKRLTRNDWNSAVQILKAVPVRLDAVPDGPGFDRILEQCVQSGLTFYDASYLELTQRAQASLATKDKALARAAQKAGLPCLTL